MPEIYRLTTEQEEFPPRPKTVADAPAPAVTVPPQPITPVSSTPTPRPILEGRRIRTLLIANRGEIARRIIRTARMMGIRTVAVYSEPDRRAPHVGEADVAVALGGSSATESYLAIDKIIAAARAAGADAVHPGYGLLSENAEFAQACLDAELTFVGPTPDNIRAMGAKIEAKRLAVAAGVPTLPSALIEGDDIVAWASTAATIGYPVLVKASAGGGGKGMRIVRAEAELHEAVSGARREAASSFGDATVFFEKYLVGPRHIEIQVFADQQGNAVHLHERECSIQRRHQKIIEEAPSPAVDVDLRRRMGDTALSLVRSIAYVGAGTVEYLLDDAGAFYFLEMNTRLQVEHPVTECITGTDLVRWQLDVAMGRPIPVTQSEVVMRGHAIEVRLYAEDPANGFLPTFGTLHRYDHGDAHGGLRFDDGVVSGDEISTFYDPMLAKIIAHAPSRAEAVSLLAQALRASSIHGVVTNRDYLLAVLGHPDFLAGRTTTAFVGEHEPLLEAGLADEVRRRHVLAATLVGSAQRRTCDRLWSFAPSGWRNVVSQRQIMVYRCGAYEYVVRYGVMADERFVVDIDGIEFEGRVLSWSSPAADEADVVVEHADGVTHRYRVRIRADQTWVNTSDGQTDLIEVPRFSEHGIAEVGGGPTAPVPGRIVAVVVQVGDRVAANQLLVVLEAMKMEHRIDAPAESVVTEILVVVGDQVDAHQVLVRLDAVNNDTN